VYYIQQCDAIILINVGDGGEARERCEEKICDHHHAQSSPLWAPHLHGPLYLHGTLSLLCGPFTPVEGLSLSHEARPFTYVSSPPRSVGSEVVC